MGTNYCRDGSLRLRTTALSANGWREIRENRRQIAVAILEADTG